MCRKIFLFCFIVYAVCNSVHAFAQSDFVKIHDGHFYIGEKKYCFVGANYWYGGILANTKDGKKRVCKELNFLVHQGITNLRILGGGEGEGTIIAMKRVYPALQPRPGVFDSTVLVGLDFLLSEMGKRNMKAVIYLSNNWEWSGGFYQYLNWCGVVSDSLLKSKWDWDVICDYVSKFYSCNSCINLYDQQVKYILSRVNIITHKRYIDDPAIMAWQLANEPRPMRPAAIPAFIKWAQSTAAFIKSIDPNHLVTTGSEGEMGSENLNVFSVIHADKNIDYATIHIWPKNWQWFKDTSIMSSWSNIESKTNDYIQKHEKVAAKIQKPLVIEEFGLPRDMQSYSVNSSTFLRNKFYNLICCALQNSVQQHQVLAGINFWAVGGMGRPAHLFWQDGDDLLGDPVQEEQGLNSVFDKDTSTWKLLKSCYEKLYDK